MWRFAVFTLFALGSAAATASARAGWAPDSPGTLSHHLRTSTSTKTVPNLPASAPSALLLSLLAVTIQNKFQLVDAVPLSAPPHLLCPKNSHVAQHGENALVPDGEKHHCICEAGSSCTGNQCAHVRSSSILQHGGLPDSRYAHIHGFNLKMCPGCECKPESLQDATARAAAFREFPTDPETIFYAWPGTRSKTVVAAVYVLDPKWGEAHEYVNISVPNHREYCHIHGYDYALRTAVYGSERDPRWDKIRFIRSLLAQGYEQVFWTDADTVFTNCAITVDAVIEQGGGRDLTFAGDQNGGL